MRHIKFSIVLIYLLLISAVANAGVLDNLVEYKLSNGLHVYLLHRNSPTVTVMLSYRAGSKQEWFGATGLAHYLEHCSSLGTTNYAPRETSLVIDNVGGNRNASTNSDCTRYYANVPAEAANLVLDIEADRMQNCIFPLENITKEREVIQEELRWRYDNKISGKSYIEFMKTMFPESAYSWTAIGKADDLTRLTQDDLIRFYTTNYVPVNAYLILVGGYNKGTIKKDINDRFEFISSGTPLKYPATKEPPVVGIRRVKSYAPGDNPYIRLGWMTVPEDHEDNFKLQLLGVLLSGGTHSYLDKEIIFNQKLLNGIGAYQSGMVLNGHFTITGIGNKDLNTDKVISEVFKIIQKVQSQGVSKEDITIAKNMLLSSTIYSLQNNSALTDYIHSAVLYNTLDKMKRFEKVIDAITSDDIQQVARKYLSQRNYVVVEIFPLEQGK